MSITAVVRRWPLSCFFAGAYSFSVLALVVIGPPRLHSTTARPAVSLVLFPVMVVGVAVAGVALTAVVAGRAGIGDLGARLTRRAPRRWLIVGLIPPVAILIVLESLRALVSKNFTPGLLAFGLAAGALAGFFEELGWTGFAYPRLRSRFGPLPAALLIGALLGAWHLPVVDSLGAASPHGTAWPAFFAAFVTVLVGLRVLISWVYNRTGSLRMAQLLHASSTGFLVTFSAPHVSAAQEATWYFAYASALWLVAIAVVALQGTTLGAGRVPAGQQLRAVPVNS